MIGIETESAVWFWEEVTIENTRFWDILCSKRFAFSGTSSHSTKAHSTAEKNKAEPGENREQVVRVVGPLNRVVEVFDAFDLHALCFLPHVPSLVQLRETSFRKTLRFLLHHIDKAVDSTSVSRLNVRAVHFQVRAASILKSGIHIHIDLTFLDKLANVNSTRLTFLELFIVELFFETLYRVFDGLRRAHNLQWGHGAFVAEFFELWVKFVVFDLLLHQIFNMGSAILRKN